MPAIQSFSLYYASCITDHLHKLCPHNLVLLIDADISRWGEGIVRVMPSSNSEVRPERACWISRVHGNKLMITLGDRSNAHYYKHDYLTPHWDTGMDALWLDAIQIEPTVEFNYYAAAVIILFWIAYGMKLTIPSPQRSTP